MTVPNPERAIGGAVVWLVVFVASWWMPNTTWALVLCASLGLAAVQICLDGLGLSVYPLRKDGDGL